MSKRKHPTLIHYDIPEIITDEFIKEFCNHNTKCKETFFINQRLFKVLNYLKNRYNDRKEFNVHEVIYRIKNNIEHLHKSAGERCDIFSVAYESGAG